MVLIFVSSVFNGIKNLVESFWEWFKTPKGIYCTIGCMFILSTYLGFTEGLVYFFRMMSLTLPFIIFLFLKRRVSSPPIR